ncbi:unnamed protein product [Rhizophagus irregularis]|nr:unnamed protein product [Rhizophagus irregularis]
MSETNEWSKWIEEAISKKHIKHYEYNHFKNIQEIGIGGFGKVYRAKWKKSPKYFALKSLLNIDEDAINELVNEIELQREVIFHDNIINFCGITISDQENQSNDIKKYLLVMEYADGGSLSHYLKENFKNLTWEDKFNLANQLASAVSCLHDEDIIHRDLHSNNVLISLRETAVPDTPVEYVNLYTECWNDNPDNRPSTHDVVERLNFIINQKQDENLDEITNQTENKDTTLNSNNAEVSAHGELSKMIQDFDKMDVNQILNENITLNNVEESSRGELSRIVQDFDKMDTKEIMESMKTTNEFKRNL